MPAGMAYNAEAANLNLTGHAHTGLDIMEQEDMLISGHPVAWDIERGAKSRELIVILHKRGYDTEHWAARLDRASQRVTHISAGPLLRTVEFKPEVRPPWDAPLKGSAQRTHADVLPLAQATASCEICNISKSLCQVGEPRMLWSRSSTAFFSGECAPLKSIELMRALLHSRSDSHA